MASKVDPKIWDPNRVFDIKPAERKARVERAQMQAANRQEYLKLSTDPFRKGRGGGFVLDPRIEQSMAVRYTGYSSFKPTMTTFSFLFAVLIGPVALYTYALARKRTVERPELGKVKARNRLWKFV